MLAFLPFSVSSTIQNCNSVEPSTAKLFTYKDMGSYQRVISTQCDETYILFPRDKSPPAICSDSTYKCFGVPLQNVAVTQSVPNTFLEALGVLDKISVASEYTTSACIAKRVADGAAEAFVSHSSDDTAHAEQMGDPALDAIFSDPWYTSSWHHAPSAGKVICEASTYELTPLGSAEWLKFFGYLFGVSQSAETQFCQTASRYGCNSLVANLNNLGSYKVPKVLFTSYSSYYGAFSVQSPPYKSRFVQDAGGVYPDLSAFDAFKEMHWTGTQVSAFRFPGTNLSQFHAALQLADVLVDETYPHGQTMASIETAYRLPNMTLGLTRILTGDDPAFDSTGWSLVSHGVGEKLFTVGPEGKLVPELAQSISKEAGGAWIVTLTAGRHFSDGTLMRAAEVAAALRRTNQLLPAAQSDVGTMTIEALDDARLSITTSIETPIMKSVLAQWWAVVYKNTTSGGRVFTGPYVVGSLGEEFVYLLPNKHYPGASERTPIHVSEYESGEEVARALRDGDVQMGFDLPGSSVAQLNWAASPVTVKSFLAHYQYMAFFNTRRDHFADVRVRKALALGIDRPALARAAAPAGMAESVVSTSVATGAFASTTSWGAERDPLPTDTDQAATLLDEAGWLLNNATGIREKGGAPFPTIDLVYYNFRPDLVTFAPHIRDHLGKLGIPVAIRADDTGNYMAADGPTFDILLWAQNTLPANDPHWFLDTFFRTQEPPVAGNWGQKNFAAYSSSKIDAALDTLATAEGAARTTAATAAQDAIIDEYPATFLTSMNYHVGVEVARMGTYQPYGADYYIVRKDMPQSDWPTAFREGRVYTLDGTMDANGPPKGGTDWYESRVAEPDAFLTDLVDVLHPIASNYAPEGLHFLRHVPTGSITSVTPSSCANPSGSRPVRSPTCSELAAANPSLVDELAAVAFAASAVLGSGDDDDDKDTGLIAATAVLGGLFGLALVAAAVTYYWMKKKAASAEEPKKDYPTVEETVA
mmetsp:Transcript_10884/g.36006  ORF Transcript_10884/g.36006 Transcript_10884/m.36006 type:complete len:985 (+) Transcript_10884:80-3034(+)